VTVISPRFAGAAIALLVAAAVPVWFHAVTVPTYDDCANPEAFFGAARIGGADMVTLEGLMTEVEGAEGQLRGGSQYRLAVRVVRSFSPSLLYASPIRFGFDSMLYLHPGEARWLEAGDDVLPVHWNSYEGQRTTRIEAHSFFHGGVPVWHPPRPGLALALRQLVGGTRPVTVLIVSGVASRDDGPAFSRAAERWLVSAWQQLEATCDF
jgi:hypothetical protein